MINLDMIGRYRSEKGLEIDGLGTSPDGFNFIHQLTVDSVKVILKDQGTGPSDHTSFYIANIPVLFFFTGTHEDYHKPSDDADKVNYTGEYEVLKYIEHVIHHIDNESTLAFAKTKDTDGGDIPQFKVRLGIIPDYAFEGPGLRIDGVDDGQPAAKAGLQKGDVIIQLGDFTVSDIMVYMKALASFQKGDTTNVKVKRNDQEMEFKVTF
jgi:C-terminal processing protease CtpA/Prc